eukprot:9031435-Pyramimonas_sp.AAC.1
MAKARVSDVSTLWPPRPQPQGVDSQPKGVDSQPQEVDSQPKGEDSRPLEGDKGAPLLQLLRSSGLEEPVKAEEVALADLAFELVPMSPTQL